MCVGDLFALVTLVEDILDLREPPVIDKVLERGLKMRFRENHGVDLCLYEI